MALGVFVDKCIGFEAIWGVLSGRSQGFTCFCTFWMTGTWVLCSFVSIDWQGRGFQAFVALLMTVVCAGMWV